ncbi:MAG: type II toxin-antitoxin system HipA family toxin [Planctomycetes bacterium]|nr:type II toxin-antitoxin system HipA family toxin [Planctomycetota bacterium]
MQQHPTAIVRIWGRVVGAVAWNRDAGIGSFEYDPSFASTGLELAPIQMPLGASRVYSFPSLDRDTFSGLPGLLADSLPDRFGNAVIDLWLDQQGRSRDDFTPVERLCYIGTRGMGALEFEPAIGPSKSGSKRLDAEDLAALADLAERVLAERRGLVVNLAEDEEALATIIQVGTSAGGARAKAVIAWNPETGEIRSGQVDVPSGFEPWILKFDGAGSNALGDPEGYGRIEYGYFLMAKDAGIEMADCSLLNEGGRAHFMTRRFDRTTDCQKIHMQSLCALGHYDFNRAGAYSYEQALQMIQQLGMPFPALEQQFRRMVFNIVARNQDDHTRNTAFLMSQDCVWSLAPAFDVIYAHNPSGDWTNKHQMSANGKRDGFSRDDLQLVADRFGIRRWAEIVAEVFDATRRWMEHSATAGVPEARAREIMDTFRMGLGAASTHDE